MDILKTATDWAKAEVFSSQFFILFGIVFLIACLGFWQLGKTDLAKAYLFPTMVAGILLLAVGVGLYYTNHTRISSFEIAYSNDASAFVQSEIVRAEKTMDEFNTIVFKIIPFIIVVAALLIIFIDIPIWRAICTTTIAMMIVVILIDINSNARIEIYHEQLQLVENEQRN